MIISDQFSTIQNLLRVLIPKPVTGQELFFAVSYGKLSLWPKILTNILMAF